MATLQFLGASGTVTGSNYLLTGDRDRILIDFGIFQGKGEIENLNYRQLLFDPSDLSGAVLTHAHLDHCGRLPMLTQKGFSGKIYMTAATKMLCEISLLDAARLEKEKNDAPPLYTEEDVEKLLPMIQTIEYDREFVIGESKIILRDAGHILGSASVEIRLDETTGKTIIFSGDLGNSPEDIIRPTEMIRTADFVVMESTYGAEIHPREHPSELLKEEIQTVEKSNGVLLIPAFSIERTQEILHRIHHLKKDGVVQAETNIFLDSPMAIGVTKVFELFPNLYNREFTSHTNNPFEFPGLKQTPDVTDSKAIKDFPNPKVIIAGSGMMSGGRIMHHALEYLPRPTTRVLLVGYQAEGTLGRRLLEGNKDVIIFSKPVHVAASVKQAAAMSSHADQPKLLSWLKHIKGIKKMYLTHGENVARQTLREKINQTLRISEVFLPVMGAEESL